MSTTSGHHQRLFTHFQRKTNICHKHLTSSTLCSKHKATTPLFQGGRTLRFFTTLIRLKYTGKPYRT